MEYDAKLMEGFEGALAAVDASTRAWIVVVGRLAGLEPRGPFSTEEIRQLVAEAEAAGDFPPGPLAFAIEHTETEVSETYQMLTVRSRLDGADYLESKVAFGDAGFLAQGFTRSGRLDEHEPVAPSHVLLVDFESLFADTILLLTRTAKLLGYVGPGRLMAGIGSAVPGQPLTLRALSEETGKLLPEGRPVDSFEPVALELDIRGSRSEAHHRCYELMTQVAPRFGVAHPQYLTDPALGTEDFGLGKE